MNTSSFSAAVLLGFVAVNGLSVRATAQCEIQKLVAEDPGADAEFGYWIGISGDTAVIGAPHDEVLGDPERGSAYVFERQGTAWSQVAVLQPADVSPGDSFGYSVAISGDTIVVGSPRDDDLGSESGAAFVFERTAGVWGLVSKLLASDGSPDDRFGVAVGIAGDVIVVGANLDDDKGADSGSAYVFERSSGRWSHTQKLLPKDDAEGDYFGRALTMKSETILVGAVFDGQGSVYVYEPGISGWEETDRLVPTDGSSTGQFGVDIAIHDDAMVIGSFHDDDLGPQSGSAYVFQRTPFGEWVKSAKLLPSDGSQGDAFGFRVGISDQGILVGAPDQDTFSTNDGAAYIFKQQGAAWVQALKFTASDGAAGDHLGDGLAFSEDTAIVAARLDDGEAHDSGSVYILGVCPPQVTSVTGTSAQSPGMVTATGQSLGQTQQVLIDGIPAALVSVAPTSVTYQPQPGTPGHVPVELSGMAGVATGVQELFPSLKAATTGIGGHLNASLGNGEPGIYVLAMGLSSLPGPVAIGSPPTWYGVLLNPAGPLFLISTGAFATSDPVALSFPVPPNPALTGLDLYFQAWCQQGFFGPEVTYSFTNMAAVTL